MLGVCEGIKRGLFYAKCYADFYANFKATSLFWLIFYGNIYANFKGKLLILPYNIYDIKRNPRVALHLQYLTNGIFVNKFTKNCLVIMLRSLLKHHSKTIKDQRVHKSYHFG